MCGIVGYTGAKRVATSVVIDGLRRLEYRGYDSSGIAYSFGDHVSVVKTVGRVEELARKLYVEHEEHHEDAFACIGHTRWATHGGVTNENAHPHSSDRVVIVHNGIIDNADELRRKLIDQGYHFVSQTDSEVIAHLIDFYLDDEPLDAITKALGDIHGTYGLAAIFNDYAEQIYVARNGSPLVIGVDVDGGHFVASDPLALAAYTNQIVYLEDGDIATISRDSLKMNRKREVQTVDLEDSFEAKGDFDHFMLKEICEQPESIRRCFGGRIRKDVCKLGGIPLSPEFMGKATSVTIIACGTSYHAGLTVRDTIEELSGIPCRVEMASEFAHKRIIPDVSGICLVISQSGETYDTIESIKELHRKGCRVFGIVNVVGSSIARLCGSGVYIHSGPEISVASTKAYTGQLAALMMFASMLGRTRDMSKKEGRKFSAGLKALPGLLEPFVDRLSKSVDIKLLAELLANSPYVMFLGRGANYPVALEGALKLKEIAYIPCEAYPAGEMKHGPIAMIEDGTPVICINPEGPNRGRMLANMEEVKARGAYIISICSEGDTDIARLSDVTIHIPDVEPELSPFFSIVPLQLFAYHAAVYAENDVDKPRNLAKSVTVS
jgi:glutamine---fructose-6-phosphate transaminase (isomerizing)